LALEVHHTDDAVEDGCWGGAGAGATEFPGGNGGAAAGDVGDAADAGGVIEERGYVYVDKQVGVPRGGSVTKRDDVQFGEDVAL